MLARLCRSALLSMVILIPLGAGSAAAQIPDTFENLKVLPSDIGKRDLVEVMRKMAFSLGMRCKGCHVGQNADDLKDYDFASDEKKTKRVAREMMKMVNEINSNLMTKSGVEDPQEVRCVTCHRGVEHPATLDLVMMKTVRKDGAEAAIEKYRGLRKEYYGSGSYDFRPFTLNTVAEELASDPEQMGTAVALLQLNLEFNPEEPSTHLLLGRLHASAGDKPAAIKSIERALELDPDNRWAKRLLQNLKSEK
jgi:tetratricopeptide (TPR) repeat protein